MSQSCRSEQRSFELPTRTDPPSSEAGAERLEPRTAVFVIDSRGCVRDPIVATIQAHRNGAETLGFHDIESCLEHRGRSATRPALLVLSCPSLGPSELGAPRLTQLSAVLGTPRIVLLVDVLDTDVLRACAQHRLDGVIPSSYSSRQMLGCLDVILSGAQLLPIECLDAMDVMDVVPCGSSASDAACPVHAALTRRQREVLHLVIEGRSNKYIAGELSLAESTVKVHVSELLRRLGATSRTHAAFLVNRAARHEAGSPRSPKRVEC